MTLLRPASSAPTALRAVGLGVLAGLGGTAVMTLAQLVEQRLRGAGDQGPPRSWDEAPAPAQVGERIAGGVFDQHVPLQQAPALNNAVHWLYGTGWGVVYGVLRGSLAAGSV